MSKKIPKIVMYKSAVMVNAELTSARGHKERIENGIQVINQTKKEPMPISRATTELRRAYPYVFDCAAYIKTHYPTAINIDPEAIHARITMPYDAFLEACLDKYTEQKDYLKEELYRLFMGQPAKYIRISDTTTVYTQPVILSFIHTDKTAKIPEYIHNINKDHLVDKVEILILKELLGRVHTKGKRRKSR